MKKYNGYDELSDRKRMQHWAASKKFHDDNDKRIAELEKENSELLKGALKKYRKEVKREEMYSMLGQTIERMQMTIAKLRQDKNELLTTIIRLQNGVNK